MSGTPVLFPIVVGNGDTIQNVGNQVTLEGTVAEMPAFALWSGDGFVGPGNALPVTDVLNLANTGSLVAGQILQTDLLENIETALAGNLKTTVPALTYTISTNGTVGVGSGTLVAAGAAGTSLTIGTLNGSTSNVWLNPTGAPAVVNAGIPVWAGGGSVEFGDHGLPMPSGPITAITDGGTPQVVTLAGG